MSVRRPRFFRDVSLGIGLDPTVTGPSPNDGSGAARSRSTAAPEPPEAVAVIGASGRFPMARDLDEYWANLVAGRDCIREIPAERWDWRALDGDPQTEPGRTNIHHGGFIEGVLEFDPLFFGISPREAEQMDPQQRLVLQFAWKVIEDAGYSADSLAGSDTGIFVATASSGYGKLLSERGAAVEGHTSVGSIPSQGPNRVSYLLDLRGPSEPVEAACSSGLVAVHRAVSAIRRGECEMCIAGAVNTIVSPEGHISYAKMGVLALDGRSRPFAEDASGYVRSEGVGMLLLKRLDAALRDGDHIDALIVGSAVGHGGRTSAFTAPSPGAQARVIAKAYRDAHVDPRTVSYVEAHGSGTSLGDAVEVEGLKMAFAELYRAHGHAFEPGELCGLGSVKSNIGHTELAAGMAGLLKVVLQLKHRRMVRSLHCGRPAAHLGLDRTPFYVVRHERAWERAGGAPLRAGVSSFGIGGVNAHVVLQEYAERPEAPLRAAAVWSSDVGSQRPEVVIPLSAKGPSQLVARAEDLAAFLERCEDEQAPALADVAYTLQVGRQAMEERFAVVVSSRGELVEILRRFVGHPDSDGPWFRGSTAQDSSLVKRLRAEPEINDVFERWIAAGKWQGLLGLWASGMDWDFRALHTGRSPRRVRLPSYPFRRDPCWIPDERLSPPPAEREPIAAPLSVEARVERDLQKDIHGLLKVPEPLIKPDGSYASLGFVSMQMAAFAAILSRRYGVRITPALLVRHPTPQKTRAELLLRFQEAIERHYEAEGGVPVERRALPAHAPVELPAPVPSVPREAAGTSPPFECPLSEGQRGLWALQQMAPGDTRYNVPVAFRVEGRLDQDGVARAFRFLLGRYPILCSRIVVQDGEPRLLQVSPSDPPLAFEEVSAWEEEALLAHLRARAREPFDLARGPLIRVRCCSRDPESHVVMFVVHHLVFDGSSIAPLARAFWGAYRDLATTGTLAAPTPERAYAELVAWQRALVASEEGRATREYWAERLSGELLEVDLWGAEHVPSEAQGPGTHALRIAAEEAETLRAVAREVGVTPAVLFLGAFHVFLQRCSGQTNIAVGMPTHGRDLADIGHDGGRPPISLGAVVGLFVNMIVTRSTIVPSSDFASYLIELQQVVADALDHSALPFARVVADLGLDASQSRHPGFQVAYAYQKFSAGDPEDGIPTADGLVVEPMLVVQQQSAYDLVLEVYEDGPAFHLELKYDASMARHATVERLAGNLRNLLFSLARAPREPMGLAPWMTPEQRSMLLAEWSGGGVSASPKLDVLSRIAGQAAALPDRLAVIHGSEAMTYGRLWAEALGLAARLRALGAKRGDLVGIHMDRTPQAIVAILGVIACGAAYVPMDPSWPSARLLRVVQDSGSTLLISDAAELERAGDSRVLRAGRDVLVNDGEHGRAPFDVAVRAEDVAYVIFTSGTTGHPKGVAVSHRSLAHLVDWHLGQFEIDPSEPVGHFSSLCFDAAVWELFPYLANGNPIHLLPEPVRMDAGRLHDYVDEHGLRALFLPTQLCEELFSRESTALRVLLTGGETLRRRPRLKSDCRVFNNYGPTEATVLATCGEVSREGTRRPTIGAPVPHARVYLLDRWMEPVPVGVAGEIYIGGAGVALGYVGDEAATEERFLADPFHEGGRMYRTGDKGRWLETGEIEFLGRADRQVKIRGYRIELAEIEAELTRIPGVRQAAVIVGTRADEGSLLAFYVGASATGAGTHQVRDALSQRLPAYMLPQTLISVSAIPVTTSGKVDRAALLRLAESETREAAREAPLPGLEERIAVVWHRELGRSPIGRSESFFDLGGHSLLALRLVTALQDAVAPQIDVATLVENPTIAGLAHAVGAVGDQDPRSLVVRMRREGDGPAFFCVHPVGGSVLPYMELARASGAGGPFYGVQCPPPEILCESRDLQDLAARYVRAIRAVEPEGPYHVGGWSLGGVLAYEVAQQLRAAGADVGVLVLLDSYAPAQLSLHEAEVLERMGLSGASREEQNAGLLARELRASERMRSVDEAHIAARMPKEAEDAGRARIFQALRDLVAAYRPRAWAGSVGFLRACTPGHAGGPTGWEPLVTGAFEIVEVAADHYAMLTRPHVELVAGALGRWMQREDKPRGRALDVAAARFVAEGERPSRLLLLEAPAADSGRARALLKHVARGAGYRPAEIWTDGDPFSLSRRKALIHAEPEDLRAQLERMSDSPRWGTVFAPGRRLTYLFPGAGDQYADMGAALYAADAVFARELDRCFAVLESSHGLDLRARMFGAGATPMAGAGALSTESEQSEPLPELHEILWAHLSTFAIEFALARWLLALGTSPDLLMGHSLGEYAAACIAGVWSLPQALAIVIERARVLEEVEEGRLLAVQLPTADLAKHLRAGVAVALVNSDRSCVVGGPVDAIGELHEKLLGDYVPCKPLTTQRAFHTPMVEAHAGALRRVFAAVRSRAPRMPVVSNVTGAVLTQGQARDPEYWVRQTCSTVRFDRCVRHGCDLGRGLFLSVGVGSDLCSFVRENDGFSGKSHITLPSLPGAAHRDRSHAAVLQMLGVLWECGLYAPKSDLAPAAREGRA